MANISHAAFSNVFSSVKIVVYKFCIIYVGDKLALSQTMAYIIMLVGSDNVLAPKRWQSSSAPIIVPVYWRIYALGLKELIRMTKCIVKYV